VDAGGDVASSSSRLQQTQLQPEQARRGGHINLPAQPGSSWDSPVLGTFLSLSPATAAGPSRSDAVLQRLPRSSNIAGLWFRLQAAVNQLHAPNLHSFLRFYHHHYHHHLLLLLLLLCHHHFAFLLITHLSFYVHVQLPSELVSAALMNIVQ
jgi:hypothetical protein